MRRQSSGRPEKQLLVLRVAARGAVLGVEGPACQSQALTQGITGASWEAGHSGELVALVSFLGARASQEERFSSHRKLTVEREARATYLPLLSSGVSVALKEMASLKLLLSTDWLRGL